MLFLYFLLLILSLPMWFWLCSRIWKIDKAGAKYSFFLFFPGIYWTFKLWDDPEAQIRPAAFANIALFLLTLTVGLQLPDDWQQTLIYGSDYTRKARFKAEKKRVNSDMERYCIEKHDASYDADLKTCVERNKKEVMEQGLDKATFARLDKHLRKSGIKGELDRSKSADSIKLAKSTQIADVASYYFLPFTMSQPQISFYLCVSATACTSYVENIKDRSIINLIRHNNLLLAIPWEALEEPKVKELINVFLDFPSGQ